MTPEGILIENMLMIANKEGKDVPFKLNTAQVKVDANLTGRDLIPKARQEGVSSYFLARSTIKCLTRRNRRAVVISHEAKATERMLAKVHYFLDNMNPKPVIGTSSKNSITFPKMNSMFYIGTAGTATFGRGDTITDLHCSEVAFWPDAKDIMVGLMQSVPVTGEVSIESTGNGQGDYYHNTCVASQSGKSHYKCHFLDWLSFDEYDLPVTDDEAFAIINNLDPDLEEDILYTDWKLTPGQLKFRRMRLAEMEYDLRKFDQEYPKTFDECFQASGRGIFSKVKFVPTDEWERVDLKLFKLKGHLVHEW